MDDTHTTSSSIASSADNQGHNAAGSLSTSIVEQPAVVSKPPNASWLWRLIRVPFWLFCKSWVRLRVVGREHIDSTRGGLFLVNHQSFLDPLFVAVFLGRPVSYLARDSLFRVPVIGWILRNTHVIPISREAARGGSIRVALERLESGFLVGIFPEGTRTSDGKVGDFRPGFLALARRTQQPVYPVGIVGADRIMPRNSNWIRPGRVDVVIGAPFTPDELRQLHVSEDDKALCLMARNKVELCTQQSSLIVKKIAAE
ncbi:MAG: lysophospholipid acyltransferase family protein [Planctomycetaceae bacterium]